MTDQKAC